MKYIVLISDGCADAPAAQLAGKTPLQAARMPHLNALCKKSICSLAENVPAGVPAGSDTAILSIFGCDPRVCYTGRSPLEAAGLGANLHAGEVSFRANLVALAGDGPLMEKTILSDNGGNVEGDDSRGLMQALLADAAFVSLMDETKMRFTVTGSFRHIAVMGKALPVAKQPQPHDMLGQKLAGHFDDNEMTNYLVRLMERAYEVLHDHPINQRRAAEGKLQANCIWLWGEGAAVALPSFEAQYHKSCTVISAVPLVCGIGALRGLSSIDVPGATGDLNTNYTGKMQAAYDALMAGTDLAVLHVEAPDECAHGGDLAGKIYSLEQIDEKIVGPLCEKLAAAGQDFRLLYLSDHPTLLTTRAHDGSPVPYMLYDSRVQTGCGLPFCEQSARADGHILPGTQLLTKLFEM